MQNNIVFVIVWLVCGAATIIAAVLASRSRRARYLGRAAVGVLFIAGGALLHVINLATGGDYAGFETVWVLVMLPAMLLLLLAEPRATPGAHLGGKLTADVSS